MNKWTDTNGRALSDYPRPSVAVDVAVLTYSGESLKVLVVRHRLGSLALPGTFLHERELLTAAADRALSVKADLARTDFRQLAIFDRPDRDDRGWVLSVAHTVGLPESALPDSALLVDVYDDEAVSGLAFDHADMVRLAVTDLRTRYASYVDPDGLSGGSFTVAELRGLYEVIFDRPFQKDSFRRQVFDALESTGEMSRPGNGRPAETYRRRGDGALTAQAMAFLAG
ncbi:NUDIX hydrolase [Rhodococcus baikonurensis]|uniref:NUDIX hydrolase n=1 Tax=Rhodococcus baikonurensis TaxID=172041 RepID=UPI003799A3B1